jgi:hypothetical protein
MTFPLQLFGGFLLQETGHSPKEKASYQESASHNRETSSLFSQPFDKVEAR